jgi:hypothetical protein
VSSGRAGRRGSGFVAGCYGRAAREPMLNDDGLILAGYL